jgi:hypothetical protein
VIGVRAWGAVDITACEGRKGAGGEWGPTGRLWVGCYGRSCMLIWNRHGGKVWGDGASRETGTEGSSSRSSSGRHARK